MCGQRLRAESCLGLLSHTHSVPSSFSLPDSPFPHLPLIMAQAGRCSPHPKLTAQRLWIQEACPFLPTTGPKRELQWEQDQLTTIITALIGVPILGPLTMCNVLGPWLQYLEQSMRMAHSCFTGESQRLVLEKTEDTDKLLERLIKGEERVGTNNQWKGGYHYIIYRIKNIEKWLYQHYTPITLK